MEHYKVSWPGHQTITSDRDVAHIISDLHEQSEIYMRTFSRDPETRQPVYTEWEKVL